MAPTAPELAPTAPKMAPMAPKVAPTVPMAPTAPTAPTALKVAPTAPVAITFYGINAEMSRNRRKNIYVTKLLHPFTCIVAGPTGCGKTTAIKELIEHKCIYPPPHHILWCYSKWQPLYTSLLGGLVEFHQGLPEQLNPEVRTLVILDDLMSSMDQSINDLFTKKSHHRKISVIHIVQNIFYQGKDQNAHYMILFKNPRDASQIMPLARQMYPHNVKFLREMYKDATKQPYSYLFIDLKHKPIITVFSKTIQMRKGRIC